MNKIRSAILIVSGPSGCGKSTLLREVYKNIPNYFSSISTTTREKRETEEDRIDYFFVSKEEFEKDIEAGNFLEWAKVHENYYGTKLKPIAEALNEGRLVIFDIDVQGHKILREKFDSLITSVFVTTPTLQILEQRLVSRDTDSQEIVERRLQNAKTELESFADYDYLIVNDSFHKATKEILAIADITRIKSKLFTKEEILANWLK